MKPTFQSINQSINQSNNTNLTWFVCRIVSTTDPLSFFAWPLFSLPPQYPSPFLLHFSPLPSTSFLLLYPSVHPPTVIQTLWKILRFPSQWTWIHREFQDQVLDKEGTCCLDPHPFLVLSVVCHITRWMLPWYDVTPLPSNFKFLVSFSYIDSIQGVGISIKSKLEHVHVILYLTIIVYTIHQYLCHIYVPYTTKIKDLKFL